MDKYLVWHSQAIKLAIKRLFKNPLTTLLSLLAMGVAFAVPGLIFLLILSGENLFNNQQHQQNLHQQTINIFLKKIPEGSSLNPYRVKAVFLGFMIDFGHRRIQMEKQSPQLFNRKSCGDYCFHRHFRMKRKAPFTLHETLVAQSLHHALRHGHVVLLGIAAVGEHLCQRLLVVQLHKLLVFRQLLFVVVGAVYVGGCVVVVCLVVHDGADG